VPATELAAAARAVGCDDVEVVPAVPAACDRALAVAGADDAVLVAGSLYVVGEARPHLLRTIR
jgi:dihydropteroate synthase